MFLSVMNSYATDNDESWTLDKSVTHEVAKLVGIASVLKGGRFLLGGVWILAKSIQKERQWCRRMGHTRRRRRSPLKTVSPHCWPRSYRNGLLRTPSGFLKSSHE